MKSILSRTIVLLALVAALAFLVGGTASAQGIPSSSHRITTVRFSVQQAHTLSPQQCGWVIVESQYADGIYFYLWEYTCDGGYHCEAVSNGYVGNADILIVGNSYLLGSTFGYLNGGGAYLNTNTFHGYYPYSCILVHNQ